MKNIYVNEIKEFNESDIRPITWFFY
jgi:hypothetical protein